MNILEMAMAAKMAGGNGGGGGSGGVSSWNSITGKPFDENNIIKPEALPEGYPYKEQSEVVLFEQEITTNEQGVYLAGFDFIELEIDKDYVVTFGGVNYPCTAGSVSMNPYLGNVGLINPEFSGTDPFFIMPSEGGAIVLPDFANQTVSVKIATVTETIHTMAPEFLPAGVGGATARPMVWSQAFNVETGCIMTASYGNGLWMSMDTTYGAKKAYRSDDGKIWTAIGGTYDEIQKFVYGDGLWLAAAYSKLYYFDKETKQMVRVEDITALEPETLSYLGGVWLFSSQASGLWYVNRSTDGKTWESQAIGSRDEGIDGFAYGKGIWVASSGKKMWYSADCVTWTASECLGFFYGVKYANGLFVAYGSSGTWWSEDGKQWTKANDYNFANILYANGLWFGYQDKWSGKGLFKSLNGKDWAATAITTDVTVTSIAYGNGVWVAIVQGDYWGLLVSNDGENWTECGDTEPYYSSVSYGGGIWIACSEDYGFYYSE